MATVFAMADDAAAGAGGEEAGAPTRDRAKEQAGLNNVTSIVTERELDASRAEEVIPSTHSLSAPQAIVTCCNAFL